MVLRNRIATNESAYSPVCEPLLAESTRRNDDSNSSHNWRAAQGEIERGERLSVRSSRHSSDSVGVSRPWGLVRQERESRETAGPCSVATWCRDLPSSAPLDWHPCRIQGRLCDESQENPKHKEPHTYSVHEWTIHCISAEVLARGYDVRHLRQDEVLPAPTLSQEVLDHAAQLRNWRRESVLVSHLRMGDI